MTDPANNPSLATAPQREDPALPIEVEVTNYPEPRALLGIMAPINARQYLTDNPTLDIVETMWFDMRRVKPLTPKDTPVEFHKNPAAAAYAQEPSEKKFNERETGAQRESIGTKVDTTLVPYEHILAAAIGLNYGAGKYSERNFELGLSERDLLGSIDRHTRAMMAGEYYDEDSQLPHYVLLSSSVAMFTALEMRGTILRDLPKISARYSDRKEFHQNVGDASKIAHCVQDAGEKHRARVAKQAEGKDDGNKDKLADTASVGDKASTAEAASRTGKPDRE